MSTSKQDAPVADASKKENSTKNEDMMDDSDIVDQEIFSMSTEDIIQRTRALDNEVRILRSESLRLSHEVQTMKDKIKENTEKVKVNKVLPYLVSNIVEILDVEPDPECEQEGGNQDADSQRQGKCAVVKTSTRQTYFLPVIGLVPADELKPGDLIGVNKDSYCRGWKLVWNWAENAKFKSELKLSPDFGEFQFIFHLIFAIFHLNFTLIPP